MFFSTTSDYDKTKYDIAGIVYSTHVEAVSAFRSFAASFGAMFGDKSEMITKKLYDAHKGAFEELMKNAIVRYPDSVGVVGVKTELSEINLGGEGASDLIAIIITGTAVVPKGTKVPGIGGQRFNMKPDSLRRTAKSRTAKSRTAKSRNAKSRTAASRTRKNRRLH
jgi:uncharacterized protein YbjQ (UPF0145 family)